MNQLTDAQRPGLVKITGMQGAIMELVAFFVGAYIARDYFDLCEINTFTYYWMAFTVLTGAWELAYLFSKLEVSFMGAELIRTKESTFFKTYNLRMIRPRNLSLVFYSDYAAWADRLYMDPKNPWSLVIEGTHCLCCALPCLLSLIALTNYYYTLSDQLMFCGMAWQMMNSVLYISQYLIQTRQSSSPNYDSVNWPCGEYMLGRPFMWINAFWTLCPLLVILTNLEFSDDI